MPGGTSRGDSGLDSGYSRARTQALIRLTFRHFFSRALGVYLGSKDEVILMKSFPLLPWPAVAICFTTAYGRKVRGGWDVSGVVRPSLGMVESLTEELYAPLVVEEPRDPRGDLDSSDFYELSCEALSYFVVCREASSTGGGGVWGGVRGACVRACSRQHHSMLATLYDRQAE